MTDTLRGRTAPTPPTPFPGKAPEPAGAYSWNAPKDSAKFAVDRSPSKIAYRHNGELRYVEVFDLFGQRSMRDPEEKILRRRLQALPQYIRRYYMQRLDEIEERQGKNKAADWLKGSFGRFVLPRVDKVNGRYYPDEKLPGALIGFRDDFYRIPWAGKRELKRLAYRLADALTNELMRETEYQMERTGNAEFSIISGYGRAAWLMTHLNMAAPGWKRYCKEELTAEEALRSAARIESAAWWLRRLRRLHDQWREHLLITSGYVHKKASAYCSDPCMHEWMAQKRANREFINSMELEDKDTGERTSLAEKVHGSTANPAVRRAELMVRMRGFEDLAKADGLAGDFYTLTAPSKFHSMQSSGKRNNKYQGASPRDTQRYLCNVWSKVRAAWARNGIRAFGFRVTEPHHDGTPHWHLLLFFQPERIEEARAIFRKYAMKLDGHEKGAAEARFTVKAIDEKFGSATGYIAKYISKNIDGHGLEGEKDNETGGELKDMAARVCAWASRWRIRQFQQIGGAPVTVYRELGRLRDRELVLHPEIEPAQAAAGSYDWFGYTQAQGGPLVARDNLRVRLNYEITENGNDYGDDVSHINGVYSPFAPQSVIYTRTTEYKIVPQRKAEIGLAVDVSGGIAAPRSSVNNCTQEPAASKKTALLNGKNSVSEGRKGPENEPDAGADADKPLPLPELSAAFNKMSRRERREYSRRLIVQTQAQEEIKAARRSRVTSEREVLPQVQRVIEDGWWLGLELSQSQAQVLIAGHRMCINGKWWNFMAGELKSTKPPAAQRAQSLVARMKNAFQVG